MNRSAFLLFTLSCLIAVLTASDGSESDAESKGAADTVALPVRESFFGAYAQRNFVIESMKRGDKTLFFLASTDTPSEAHVVWPRGGGFRVTSKGHVVLRVMNPTEIAQLALTGICFGTVRADSNTLSHCSYDIEEVVCTCTRRLAEKFVTYSSDGEPVDGAVGNLVHHGIMLEAKHLPYTAGILKLEKEIPLIKIVHSVLTQRTEKSSVRILAELKKYNALLGQHKRRSRLYTEICQLLSGLLEYSSFVLVTQTPISYDPVGFEPFLFYNCVSTPDAAALDEVELPSQKEAEAEDEDERGPRHRSERDATEMSNEQIIARTLAKKERKAFIAARSAKRFIAATNRIKETRKHMLTLVRTFIDKCEENGKCPCCNKGVTLPADE